MSVDVSKLQFYSGYPIDKITYSFTSSTYSVPANTEPNSGTLVGTITNPYGTKCYTTASYTTDGTNYYDQNAEQNAEDFGVSVGCDNSNIYIYAWNATSSVMSVTLNISIDTID